MSVFRRKKVFLLLCCATYMCAYLNRVNLSTSLDKLGAALQVTPATLGLLGTAYFFVYACFQLISGFAGDRMDPMKLICIGAVGVAAMNVGISFSESYPVILVLWCLNGIFQSMFWGPMSRMIAARFDPQERLTASTCMSLSMPCSYIISWSVLSPLLIGAAWPWYFRIPGLIMVIPMILWLGVSRQNDRDAAASPAAVQKPTFAQTMRIVKKERIWLIAIVCISNGILKESFTIWAPMIMTKLLGLDVKSSALYLVLFPVLNALFIFLNGRIVKRTGISLCLSLKILYLLVAACAVLLMIGLPSAILTVVLMALVSGFGYAENNVLLGIMPMDYADENITSSLVGIFDFSAYIGAGLAAYGLGLLITGNELTPIAAVWLAAAVIGLAALLFTRGRTTRRRTVNN